MSTDQKVIKAKVGLLELAKQLGSVSQAVCEGSGLRSWQLLGWLRVIDHVAEAA